MLFKITRPFEFESFEDVDLNMLFRVEVYTGRTPGYESHYVGSTLVWMANNPTPGNPVLIRLIDIYNVFTPTLLESASFKVELAKWFNGVIDDILDSGEGSWDTGRVVTYFKPNGQPPPYGIDYQLSHPGFVPMSPPARSMSQQYGKK